jgi:hypothetical protein
LDEQILSFQLVKLSQSLQGRDLGYLRIIADLWHMDFDPPDARVGLERLTQILLQADLAREVVEALPDKAQKAIAELARNHGALPWSTFTRRYGELREMGAARRDRERPFEDVNASATEALWYRGLIGRTFFDTADGPQEFAYIPADLLDVLPKLDALEEPILGRPASPVERRWPVLVSDRILDDACTLLAALRMGKSLEEIEGLIEGGATSGYRMTNQVLLAILDGAELLDQDGIPKPDAGREFLEAPRGEALRVLAQAWLHSPEINELHLLPGIIAEGEWQNNPLNTREKILDFLSTLLGYDPEIKDESLTDQPFWSLSSFVSAIGQFYPDFQRPAGDYDSWYLRDQISGEYLRGFQHWDSVDGELIRFTVTGLMHWLGLIDIAMPEQEASKPVKPTAFRFSRWFADLATDNVPPNLGAEDGRITVRSDGRIRAPFNASRAGRYQVARFCEWDGMADGFYRYRLTPVSLNRAKEQGLRISHLLSLLRRYANAVPPSLIKALERWEAQGSVARLEKVTILRVKNADILRELKDSRVARFLSDPLSPTTIIVHPEAWEKVIGALAEMGYLGEVDFNDETFIGEE